MKKAIASAKRSLRSRGGILALCAAATLLLYSISWLRWLAYPLLLLSTLAHELGHGLTALLVGGTFESLKIWADGSGVAAWHGAVGRLGMAVVAAGGLIGPAIAAGILFGLARRQGAARVALASAGVFLVVLTAVWVRNPFGFAFVLLLAISCGALAFWTEASTARFALVFLAVQLGLSVFSRADYLFTEVARTEGGLFPSDTAQIAEALWLPYWFWGALCGALSLATVAFGLRIYLQGVSRRR